MGSKISFIIVEDDDSIREGISSFLDSIEGFVCSGAFDSCESAIEKINKLKRDELPDIVLMDISLKGMSGIEGVLRLKANHPDLIILMLTVYEDDQKIFDSLRAGASGYLLKRTPLDKIPVAINEAISGGAPMTPIIAKKVLNYFHSTAKDTATFNLTAREGEILELLTRGMSYKKIAEELFISIDTVRSHIKNIYDKLHVHSKSEAVAKALKHKLF
jgi:DNA-binding NarL/FixJ family response regulator